MAACTSYSVTEVECLEPQKGAGYPFTAGRTEFWKKFFKPGAVNAYSSVEH